jgi:two-component system, chemotaxis family, chemotaxis protein CheY
MTKTILVVDDSASMRQVVSGTLESAGFNTVVAVDGVDALKKLDQHRVNLIISDVNMPNMDGISFLKEVKQRTDTRFTPVIMLTTESVADKKEQGRQAGAKAWIVKPFQPDQVVSAVHKLLMC